MHAPVLAQELVEHLDPKEGESYLDFTAGYGGHASLVFSLTSNFNESVLCDRDEQAVRHVKELFPNVNVLQLPFSEAARVLADEKKVFDLIVADLGVSSPHLDNANRGFSITRDGPLDMRMDQSRGRSAADIVNSASADELETILRVYGEEPLARRIVARIIEHRPIASTHELASLVKKAYGKHTERHPATRTFQALRIAVNDELGELERMLPLAVKLLSPGGRLAIITFHSLEDRLVKQFFANAVQSGYESELELVTKKPITAGRNELSFNPRSRSAKLRIVAKIKRKDH